MTEVEKTYKQLKQAGLVQCAEAFSRYYLGKNRNWYAYTKHKGLDYSMSAAISCLRSIRSQQHSAKLSACQLSTLQRTEHQLLTYLGTRHGIADVY